MAEELQGGICGGNWWTSSRNLFGSSPCSLATNDFGWLNHDPNPIMDLKATKSSDDSAGSASDAWNQDFLHDSGKSEQNYSNILQEGGVVGLDSSRNYRPQDNVDLTQIQEDWSKNFSQHSNSFNTFRQVNQSFPLEQPPLNSISNSAESAGFPLNSASYSYTTSLLQTLFDLDSQPQQAALLDNNQGVNYSSVSNDQFLPGLPKLASPMINQSFVKQNHVNHLPFTSNTSVWDAQFLPSSVNTKPNLPTFSAKENEAKAAKKPNNEPAFKRPRIETPSPLPTFKVRKEKLGDRITALQQLVSPFGKTDTASVLHEAIEYIKFLHDQVSVYSAPYLKNGATSMQRQQAADHKNQEGRIQDLKSRGLCLVPISSTFPVAAETTADFWTPTFGGTFK